MDVDPDSLQLSERKMIESFDKFAFPKRVDSGDRTLLTIRTTDHHHVLGGPQLLAQTAGSFPKQVEMSGISSELQVKALPLPCVSTAFVAETLPFLALPLPKTDAFACGAAAGRRLSDDASRAVLRYSGRRESVRARPFLRQRQSLNAPASPHVTA